VSQSALSLPHRRAPTALSLVPSGRSVVLALAVALGALGMYGLARATSMFAVQRVEVQGASPALAAQVRAALSSFEGKDLLGLNGGAVVRRVDDLPSVFSATYDRDFPNTLRVRVVPEIPVAVLRRGESSWLVSARGRVVAGSDRTGFRSLPRIWLPSTADVETGTVAADQSGGAAARSVAVVLASGFAHRVAWARTQDGLLTLGLRTGLELRLGPPADLRLKLAIASEIVPTLVSPALGGPAYLDLTVPERPVAGHNPQPGG